MADVESWSGQITGDPDGFVKLIFDSPARRSVKKIGTSCTLLPARIAR